MPERKTKHTVYGALLDFLGNKTRQFHNSEDGVLVGFGISLLLIFLAVAGIGIDLMRFEYTRTSLQGTLDRAVLAAADLDQQLDAEFVVEDYFEKSNKSDYLQSIVVDQGLNYKEVSATAEIAMDTQFLHMLGIDALTAAAQGTAAESVDGVEIALVLDMSGSMNSNSRLHNLKDAAQEFVSTMINSSPPGDVAVSIVPYETQVNAGETLGQHFNLSNEHNYSHCVNFSSSDFNSTSISTTTQLQRTGPFDKFYQSANTPVRPTCPVRASSQIMAYSLDETELHNYIENFSAGGNTSTDLGVKWGAALLDPAMAPVVNNMIADGDVDAAFAGLPTAYEDDSLKVMVVMSDGQNTSQYYLHSNYRQGNTDVWYYEDGNERVYSVKSGSYYYYKRPHDYRSYYDGYKYARWVNSSGNTVSYKSQARYTQPYKGSSSHRLTFPELFNQASLEWISDALYYDIWSNSYADSYWRWNAYSAVGGSTKNARMDAICTAAKEAGIIIFSIGFEAPSSGQAVLEDCASSDAHYFDVEGIEISDAFTSIASSISKLRLVQ